MCGLAGFLLKNELDAPESVLESMGEMLVHRGPDAKGLHFDGNTGLGMVHRRLSIIDPSPKGDQPMVSDSGRYRMVYNGEVYNFQSLNSERGEGGANGDGDSAMILEAFDVHGIEASLKKFRGMFALAVFDRKDRSLTLARDSMGIKPLYYGWTGSGTFLFGSELKALEAHSHFDAKVDAGGLNLLLRFGNIPQPHTIYSGVMKLSPGHLLRISLDQKGGRPDPQDFRSPLNCAKKGWDRPFAGSREDAIVELREALKASVKEHLVSDVSLGGFLSGGVDSSLICALAQDEQLRPLKTFTIGFDEKEFDETGHARRVAEHLGTEHQEFILNSREVGERVPQLMAKLDEPFADSSFIPTFMVSELTRKEVKVSLSGDGGDELFGGYERYRWTPAIWKRFSSLPIFLRKGMAGVGTTFSQKTWGSLMRPFEPLLPEEFRGSKLGSRIHRLSRLLDAESPRELYHRLMTHFGRKADIQKVREGPVSLFDHDEVWGQREDLGEKLMLMDLLGYLSDDILTKVDRASMAVGLEARVPFITPELVELVWSFPPEWRRNKELLIEILGDRVPKEVMNRPKMGFGVPLASWLRGPLREWASDLMASSLVKDGEWFEASALEKIWLDHLSEKSDRSQEIWVVLSFLDWKSRH